jgi:hypothetical protein
MEGTTKLEVHAKRKKEIEKKKNEARISSKGRLNGFKKLPSLRWTRGYLS